MPKIIALSGDVGWEITAEGLRTELVEANGSDVEFHISSRGGVVFEGIEMFNLIRAYKGNTKSVLTGIAASMGSYILLASDKVVAYDNATFMIHNALSFAIGNHNDMRKTADVLESLSGMLAKVYASKTGKSMKEIKALMDDETWSFGQEILDAGFVDEIIESPESEGDTDGKESALISARASVESCLTRMRDSEAANDDFTKAVAYVDSMALLLPPTEKKKPSEGDPEKVAAAKLTTTPAAAGQQKQEDKYMSLETLLAENSAARTEHDALMAQARTEGATAARDEMKAVIASISPKLMSDAYGPDVKDAGIKAITGEGHQSTFDTLVVIADRDIQAAKAKAAADETNATGETAGQVEGDEAAQQAAFDAKLKRTEKVA